MKKTCNLKFLDLLCRARWVVGLGVHVVVRTKLREALLFSKFDKTA